MDFSRDCDLRPGTLHNIWGSLAQLRGGRIPDLRGNRPNVGKCFFWLDYTSLRQRQNDFDPQATVELIGRIGALYASMDPAFDYLGRSFCVADQEGESTLTAMLHEKFHRGI